MFNDERIYLEMSRLKKLIIIISLAISSFFLIYKIICSIFIKLHLSLYITESVICLTSIICLLGSLFIRSEVKDEMYYSKKANYYNKVFKIFIYISFISFAIAMPSLLVYSENTLFSSNLCITLTMLTSLFIGYGYLRLKRIYFNYNIIEESSKVYYKNVFKNILKIMLFFGIVYSVATVVSIVYADQIGMFGAILAFGAGFISTFIGNSSYYLFISFLERLYYKQENSKKIIKIPTIILLSISCFFIIITLICNGAVAYLAGIYQTMFIKDYLVILSSISSSTTFLCKFFSILTVVFLVSDICTETKQIKKANIFVFILITFIVVELLVLIIYNGLTYIVSQMMFASDDQVKLSSIIQNHQIITNNLNCGFYFIYGLIGLIVFKKNFKLEKKLKALIISWLVYYVLKYKFIQGVAYWKEYHIYLVSYILMFILITLTFIYVLIKYIKLKKEIIIDDLIEKFN